MKKMLKIQILIVLSVFLTFPAGNVYAKKWVVKVSNDKFVPYNLTHVTAGDTIRWEWVEGVHTTTSTSIPDGADPWDAPITQFEPAFVIRPNVNGTYSYTCTAHTGTMNGTFIVSGASGITPDQGIPRLNVFPNPFTDRITIETPGAGSMIKSIKIYSQDGRMIRAISYGTTSFTGLRSIDLKDLEPGVYTVSFTDNLNRQSSKRIIRQ